MATRPRSILWVDDESEGLESHRRFLEEQGYAVESASNGDDGPPKCLWEAGIARREGTEVPA